MCLANGTKLLKTQKTRIVRKAMRYMDTSKGTVKVEKTLRNPCDWSRAHRFIALRTERTSPGPGSSELSATPTDDE